MSFNVPIAVGFGNGLGAPAGFLFATVVAPGLGGLGMLYTLYLLWTNRAFAAGYGSYSRILELLPAYVVLTLGAGFGYALWLRRAHPAAYLQVGPTTVDEAHERG